MDLEPSPYGVNSHEDTDVLARLATYGLRWHRVDFRWAAIAVAPNQYHWGVADSIAAKAEECGVSLLVSAAYTPRWASRQQDQKDRTEQERDALPPVEPERYTDFVAALVERFRGRIQCLSLWNEPNDNRSFWRGTPEQYIQMVLPALRVVRELDPDLAIAGPDLAMWPDNNTENWMNHLLQANIPGGFYDVVTHHQYGADHANSVQSRLDRIDKLRDYLRGHGLGSKPLWLTETGWNNVDFTSDEQARRLQEVMRAMEQRADWWKKTFWYDSHSPKEGLIPVGKEARPALEAYAQIIRGAGIVPPIGRATAGYRTRILYQAVLRRSLDETMADTEGLEAQTRQLQRTSTAAVCQAFLNCPEFPARWGSAARADIARHIVGTIPGTPQDDATVASLAADLESGHAATHIADLIGSSRPA